MTIKQAVLIVLGWSDLPLLGFSKLDTYLPIKYIFMS